MSRPLRQSDETTANSGDYPPLVGGRGRRSVATLKEIKAGIQWALEQRGLVRPRWRSATDQLPRHP